MSFQIGSPTRSSRLKRDSLTITRSVGKALADVMNKDQDSTVAPSSSTESEHSGSTGSPVKTRAAGGTKPAMATIREGGRASRPSLVDTPKGNGGNDKTTEKSTSKLTKRAPPPSKPPIRSHTTIGSPISRENHPKSPVGKPSKPRASLTLRSLSSALQPKSGRPPSALPKYKPRATTESLGTIRSGTRKRLSDWDVDKAEEKDKGKIDDIETSDDDEDDGFVTVDRPISPLPRRAARKTILPVSLSLTPSTPQKSGNVLHKTSRSLSSTPPRASKTAKNSATPLSPMTRLLSSQPRPPSVASVSSQRATPVQNSRRPPSSSRVNAIPSARSVQRQPAHADSPISSSGKLESSPGTPLNLPETTGGSLLSPPASPYLDGVSIDSIDANDVSAFLSTIVSPTKATPAPSRTLEVSPQATSQNLNVFPKSLNSLPPQTPVSSRSISTFTTDPRQSVLSLRQFLENSGDLDHLLSQPLPSILSPDARERLLSFGFSPDVPPPPFFSAAVRPEPQTPSPVQDQPTFTSISQVLFPSAPAQSSTEQPPSDPAPDLQAQTLTDLNGDMVENLRRKLRAAENQRIERDAKIESLEAHLSFLREAREREAAELATQVTDLEAKLQEHLCDQEQEAERRASEIEGRLREKDVEWERLVTTAVAQIQERDRVDRERLLSMERRQGSIRSAVAAWEGAKEIASSELELLRYNKRFIELTLTGLDISMQQLRL